VRCFAETAVAGAVTEVTVELSCRGAAFDDCQPRDAHDLRHGLKSGLGRFELQCREKRALALYWGRPPTKLVQRNKARRLTCVVP